MSPNSEINKNDAPPQHKEGWNMADRFIQENRRRTADAVDLEDERARQVRNKLNNLF